VAAESFTATVCTGVRTHFRRPEDATMTSGKLDGELRRMSAIAGAIAVGSLRLCNESFAATNEREGQHLAREVVRAILNCGVRVLFATNFYDFASGFDDGLRDDGLFLRADRQPDGSRSFRLTEAPLLTTHAWDTYDLVFRRSAVLTTIRCRVASPDALALSQAPRSVCPHRRAGGRLASAHRFAL